MISTTASTATKSPPPAVTARRIKIPLPPAPPTTPRLGIPLPPPSSSSSNSSSTTSSAHHSPSPSLSSLGSLNSYSSAVSSFNPITSLRSLRYRGSCRHIAPPSPKCAELAGGTAAECAVVFCCCPCGIVNLLYLAVLKLPAGLCRRAIRNRRRMLAKKKIGNPALLPDVDDDGLLVIGRTAVLSGTSPMASLWPVEGAEPSEEMWEMEKEMWNLFYGTGFWRSPSQREVELI